MIIKWEKIGLLYDPSNTVKHPKLLSHAANPLPVKIDKNLYRVFFSGRDVENRSSIGAVDIDLVNRTIICEHLNPIFEHGPEGSFYADGVSIGNCYESNGTQFMLFMGWQNSKNYHWRGDIGRLILKSDLSLELDGEKPFISSNKDDPISLSYPWVMKHNNTNYQMWYGSTKTWDSGDGEMVHLINHAVSSDGHNWDRKGLSIPYELGRAQAFSRPSVIKNNNGSYDMWFSYRGGTGDTYRIGYAYSKDGSKWVLELNNGGISVSESGWDSEMVEYPFVLDHDGERYMLYNGNGYGKSGFGLAVLTER